MATPTSDLSDRQQEMLRCIESHPKISNDLELFNHINSKSDDAILLELEMGLDQWEESYSRICASNEFLKEQLESEHAEFTAGERKSMETELAIGEALEVVCWENIRNVFRAVFKSGAETRFEEHMVAHQMGDLHL